MSREAVIRETAEQDAAAVLALYPLAFPDEDLRPVVTSLLALPRDTLSLGAFEDDAVAGHVLFTLCGSAGRDRQGALLAPLGVTPSHQRRGLGSALVRAGLDRLEANRVCQVFVLGDPAYYRRFGFAPERRVLPPFPIPDDWADAWQSVSVGLGTPLAPGRLSLPGPWMDPALWQP